MADFYINAETFDLATSIYADIALSTLAPDGFYSMDNGYRQQVGGVLIGGIITCDEPIVANNDSYSSVVTVGMNGNNILVNDTVNGVPATTGNVQIAQVSSTNANVNINTSNGAVVVNSIVPVGTYSIVYRICQLSNITNCATANISVSVTPLTIQHCYNFDTTCELACGGTPPEPTPIAPTTLTGFNQPYQMTSDNEGTVYVLNYGNHSISKIAQNGSVTHNWGFTNSTNDGNQMVCDTSGNLFIVDCKTDTTNATITKFTKTGVRTLNWSGPITRGHSLAIDSNDILYTTGAEARTSWSTINTSGVVTLRVPANTMVTAGSWSLVYNKFKNRVSVLGDSNQYNLDSSTYSLNSTTNNLYMTGFINRAASNEFGLISSIDFDSLQLHGENVNTAFAINITIDNPTAIDIANTGTTFYMVGTDATNQGYVFKVLPTDTDTGTYDYVAGMGSGDIKLNNFGNVFVTNYVSNTVSVFLE